MNNPLTFTAEESNSTIKLVVNGKPVIDGLQYRLNANDDWKRYKIGTKIELENVGDYVQFQNTNNELSTSYSNFVQFVMTGKIAASDNIQSMLNYSDSCTPYCYISMFWNCKSLTKAPMLPATTLAEGCYTDMFYDCISLTKVPELPATTLANGCYRGMFEACIILTEAPFLPATTLAYSCYYFMFRGCISLTKAPELPATTLAEDCYRGMFYDCSNLKNKSKLNSLIEKMVYIH